jgi:hypothetical protein
MCTISLSLIFKPLPHARLILFFSNVTVMPRKAADKPEKAAKPHIPDINWAANQSLLIWSLLAEIEKAENYRVLYGKKESSEVNKFYLYMER